jgi:hypothetical protein
MAQARGGSSVIKLKRETITMNSVALYFPVRIMSQLLSLQALHQVMGIGLHKKTAVRRTTPDDSFLFCLIFYLKPLNTS